MTSSNDEVRLKAAKTWSIWEASTSKLFPNNSLHQFNDIKVAEAFARIECHYFINKGFFETDNCFI